MGGWIVRHRLEKMTGGTKNTEIHFEPILVGFYSALVTKNVNFSLVHEIQEST